MSRPRLLDLFCGAGGAAMGYHRAGFEVVGVDVRPQPRFPFEFHQADAMEFMAAELWRPFQVVHASPPCQRYSRCADIPGSRRKDYPDLLGPTLAALQACARPWVVENVTQAPMGGIVLCGQMFALGVFRHRRFASSHLLFAPHHGRHRAVIGKKKMGQWLTGPVLTVCGHTYRLAEGKKAMGIDWMRKDELSEAVPPAYTEYVGRQLYRVVTGGQP